MIMMQYVINYGALSISMICALVIYFIESPMLKIFLLCGFIFGAATPYLSLRRTPAWGAALVIVALAPLIWIINVFISDVIWSLPLLIFSMGSVFFSFYMIVKRKAIGIVYNIFFCFVLIVTIILISGYDPELIFTGSRNTTSLILVPLGAVFLILKPDRSASNYVVLYFLIFLCCVLSYGRAGIFTSFLLLISLLIYLAEKKNKYRFYLVLFCAVAFALLAVYFYKNFDYFDYFKAKLFQDSYRQGMISEYMEELSALGLFFGENFADFKYISSFNYNPHNSYIYFHAAFGLFAILIYFVCFVFLCGLILNKNLSAVIAFLAALLRLSTDSSTDFSIITIMFPVAAVLLWPKFFGYKANHLNLQQSSCKTRLQWLGDSSA